MEDENIGNALLNPAVITLKLICSFPLKIPGMEVVVKLCPNGCDEYPVTNLQISYQLATAPYYHSSIGKSDSTWKEAQTILSWLYV